ncbi:MAG: glycosyltransferase family 4 protein [Rhodospirillales bacterium]|jgi:UDP-N-acetylmuramyl pentapeptide phosphotransferase/UDP-N-acetylglucosamine-1-phosphate transferase|nr:glycosyltransferase family 4 protein [Rhodospirillales bacterium]
MSPLAVAFLCLAVLAAVAAATRLVLAVLRRRAILDHPNERSSHRVPTPRGGGLAVIPVLLAAWMAATLWGAAAAPPILTVCGLALALGVLSWIDDLKGLSPAWRLLGQAAAVAVALYAVPPGPIFGGLLPGLLDTLAAALLWLWYINLFNFMDGIDGLSGVEAASTGGGLAVVAILAGLGPTLPTLGLTLAAAALGFLWWNWQPARIFLGDVGSVPLGFLIGWLLLTTAAHGEAAAAVIVALYYLADATLTLGRRALRGEKVWRPHREHFYQQAVQQGASHARVATAVLVVNGLLAALAAAAALGWAGPALAGAAAVVAALLLFLKGGAGAKAGTGPLS